MGGLCPSSRWPRMNQPPNSLSGWEGGLWALAAQGEAPESKIQLCPPQGTSHLHPRVFSPSSISFLLGTEVFLPPLPVFLESQNEGVLQRTCSHSGLGIF